MDNDVNENKAKLKKKINRRDNIEFIWSYKINNSKAETQNPELQQLFLDQYKKLMVDVKEQNLMLQMELVVF